MAELIAAMPWQAWAAGLAAAMVGGLCAALAQCEPDDAPAERGPGVRRGEWREEVL